MTRRSLLVLSVWAAVATVAGVFVIDDFVRNAHWFGGVQRWRDGLLLVETLTGMNVHKWYTVAALLAVAALAASRAPWRPWAVPFIYVALVHYVSREATTMLKPMIGRLRPHQLPDGMGAAQSFFETGVAFPSGHAAHFFSLALPLALLFPRWRVPLLAVPIFVGLARILPGDHFVSDVLGSVVLVSLITVYLALAFRLPK